MDTWAVEAANGVTWMRDCLLQSGGIARAIDRIQARCSAGIRYFSEIGRAVPLDQVGKVAFEISKAEDSETLERHRIEGKAKHEAQPHNPQ